MSLTIKNNNFRDTSHLIDYITSIRQEYPCNQVIKLNSDHGDFLWHLLMLHPRWPLGFTSGVTAFKTGKFRARNQNGFSRVDRAGRSVPFNFLNCVNGGPPTVVKRQHCVAFRGIVYQLEEFERSGKKQCDTCEREFDRKYLASYSPPRSFRQLWASFTKGEPGQQVSPQGKFVGRDSLVNWQTYHKRNAVLAALCQSCYYRREENKT